MANLPLEIVKKLYYTQGLTAQKVGESLGTTSSVVYKFMKRKRLPRRAIQESNRIRFEKTPLSFKIKTDLNLREEHLKIAGIMLYWAEGSHKEPDKSKRPNWTVEFSNSDPVMIRFFLRFLRETCGVEEKRLRIHIYCYADQNLKSLQRFWIRTTRVPFSQFTKPYIREDTKKKYGRETKYGTIHIRYSDKRLLQQIRQWIKEYTEN